MLNLILLSKSIMNRSYNLQGYKTTRLQDYKSTSLQEYKTTRLRWENKAERSRNVFDNRTTAKEII